MVVRRKRKRPRWYERPGLWGTILVLLGAGLAGWYLFGPSLSSGPPALEYLDISVNGVVQRVRPEEAVALRPRDKVAILEVATTVPLNFGVRLACQGLDAEALTYQELPVSGLLPESQSLEPKALEIRVKKGNADLGRVYLKIAALPEDWIDRTERIIAVDQRIAFLEQAVRSLPNEPLLADRLLEEYLVAGKSEKASALLEARTRVHPEKDSLLKLLQLYTQTKDKKGEIHTLERLVKADPKSVVLRTQLAAALEEDRQVGPAIAQYEAVLSLTPHAEALALYKKLGFLASETGDARRAVTYYERAGTLDKRDANLYYNLAYLYEKLGDPHKADFYMNQALALSPEDEENRIKMARAHLDKGNLGGAEAFLKEVLKHRPNHLEALLLMIQVAEKKNDRKALVSLYEKAVALDPKNETAAYNLGVLHYEAGDLGAALPLLKVYAVAHPQDAEVRGLLIDIYKRQNQTDLLVQELKAAIAQTPRDLSLYRALYETMAEKGEYAGLIPILEKGLKAAPQASELREYLIVCDLKTGREKEALQEMDLAVRERPNDIKLLLTLGRLAEKLDDRERALGAYKRILEISPNHEEAQEAFLRLRLGGVGKKGAP